MSVGKSIWQLRFVSNIGCETAEGCVLWRGRPDSGGYGTVTIKGRGNIRAHRVAYELVKGPIPKGYCIHHVCENRLCINPKHLRVLTIGAHSVLHGPPPSQKGRKHSPETRAKMRASHGHRPLTVEAKAKISAFRKKEWAEMDPQVKAERMARMRARKRSKT